MTGHLNPAPTGTGTLTFGGDYPTYPSGSYFILPTTLHVKVDALHAECSCSEMVEARPDTLSGRCELLDFARVHAASCDFPADELRARLP